MLCDTSSALNELFTLTERTAMLGDANIYYQKDFINRLVTNKIGEFRATDTKQVKSVE